MGTWFAARRKAPADEVRALAMEAEALASFEGVADEQIVAFAGAAVGFAAVGDADAAARTLAAAQEKSAALSHLVIMAPVVPMAMEDMERLR